MNLIKPGILDFEASGLGVGSYPIEIGVVLADGRRYSALLKPAREWRHWDRNAEKLHGLSRDLLLSRGRPLTQVAAELNILLAGKTLYSDGWVVDKPWLSQLFYQAGLTPGFFLSPLENILNESQMALWENAKRTVISELALTRHRASTDALIIQETYCRSRQMAQQTAS